jgi:hypothetical protein
MAKPKIDAIQLVTVEKEGVRLDVHPTCLADHLAIGWKVVEEPAEEVPADLDGGTANETPASGE